MNSSSPPSEIVQAPFFNRLLAALHYDHVALFGPRGTGKSFATERAAFKLGKSLFRIAGHADLGIEELRGYPGLRAGDSTFTYSPLLLAARDGGLLVFDEVNLCRPGSVAFLNTLLDDTGEVYVPELDATVPIHPAFRAVLCYNVGYQGTRLLNEATLDRCQVIYADYWPEEQERRLLLRKVPRLRPVDVARIFRLVKGIREARRKGEIDFDLSIRTIVQWARDADARTQDLLESFLEVVLPKVGDPALCLPQHEALTQLARLTLSR